MRFLVKDYHYDKIARTWFADPIHMLPYMVTKVTIYGNIVESNCMLPNRLISNAVFDGESHGTIFRCRSPQRFSST